MGIEPVKDGVWFLDVRLVKDGRQYRKRETFEGGRKAAEARHWEIKRELAASAETRGSLKVSVFGEIIDYYLARTEIDPDSKTYLFRLKEDLGPVPVLQLRDRFDGYMLCLRKTKSRATGRPLSNQTLNHYQKWAKAALNLAVRQGLIEKNPLEHFRPLPTVPRDRMLSEDEKARLLATVEEEAPHLYPIVRYALLVPCRRGELTTLRREEYDMIANVIRIPAERTKTKRPCIKPVPACMLEYFRSVPVESPWLFYRRDFRGQYLPLGDFRKALNRCKRIAKIANWRFHDARRGAYTEALLAGNLPHTVQQVSGHARDMSKVYFGWKELLAAKSFTFGQNPPKAADSVHSVVHSGSAVS